MHNQLGNDLVLCGHEDRRNFALHAETLGSHLSLPLKETSPRPPFRRLLPKLGTQIISLWHSRLYRCRAYT